MPLDELNKHAQQAKQILRELEQAPASLNLAAGLILSARSDLDWSALDVSSKEFDFISTFRRFSYYCSVLILFL